MTRVRVYIVSGPKFTSGDFIFESAHSFTHPDGISLRQAYRFIRSHLLNGDDLDGHYLWELSVVG